MDHSRAILAIGNCGRQDDGLGWAFGNFLEQENLFFGDVFYRYQLQIDDAELISKYDHVLFVDASRNQLPNGFDFQTLIPNNEFVLTTHALDPQTVLYLSEFLYDHKPNAELLQITGHHWNLEEGLTKIGKQNLHNALSYFQTQYELVRVFK